MTDITQEEAQSLALSFPEGGWIAVCGYYLPSEVQWLYKSFKKQVINKDIKIPDYSTTSFDVEMSGDISTLGSGKTGDGTYIHERISIDWLRYAIQKRL